MGDRPTKSGTAAVVLEEVVEMELLKFPDAKAIHQTCAWVVPGKEQSLESIEVLIDEPPPGVDALAVPDLKAWALSTEQKPRFLKVNAAKNSPAYKKVTPGAVLTGYLRAVLTRAGLRPGDTHSLHLLMPALANNEVHARYLKALTRAVQDAFPKLTVTPLSEPEMVLEFFRLVKGLVRLRQGANSFFLVVDSGASTTNFTIVMSTRAGEVTDASKRRRLHNLRSISFDAALLAGRAVDESLLDRLAPDHKGVPPEMRANLIANVESAKVTVARSRADTTTRLSGATATLTYSLLREATKWLWSQLAASYEGVAKLLLEQLQCGAAGKLYAPILAERKIATPRDVSRLFDAVFIAGGTSRMPGFEDDLRSVLGIPESTPIHAVHGAYPVAAVVGGLAHALARTTDAALPSGGNDSKASATQDEVTLTPALPWSVVLDCQDRRGHASTPRLVTVLRRDDNVASLGGEVSFPLPGSWTPQMKARARLVPSLSADFDSERLLRRGLRYQRTLVRRHGGTGKGTYNVREQRLSLRSDDAPGLSQLSFFAGRLVPELETDGTQAQAAPRDARAPCPGPILVVDLGMSKTIIAHAPPGESPGMGTFDHFERETPGKLGFGVPSTSQNTMPPPPLQQPTAAAVAGSESTNVSFGPSSGVAGTPQPVTGPSLPPVPSTPKAGHPTPAALVRAPVEEFGRARVLVEPADVESPAPDAATVIAGARPAPMPFRMLASPLELAKPAERIREVIASVSRRGVGVSAKQLAIAYLALCTRRFILMAGAPGSGKSTLARMLAQTVGLARGNGFVDLSVQAHWIDDSPLFGNGGALSALPDDSSGFHLVLLDEVNLARPEYYLSRLFGALDHHGQIQGRKLPPLGLVGTLNIDEFSRPPSPKVLDRAMLIVIEPLPPEVSSEPRCAWQDAPAEQLAGEIAPPVRAEPIRPGLPTAEAKGRISAWLEAAHKALESHDAIRADLVPSHRARQDVLRYAALHESLGLSGIVTIEEALDQAILGRFLSNISGPELEVKPLLDAWKPLCSDLPATRRRLTRMLEQIGAHGYASFWQ